MARQGRAAELAVEALERLLSTGAESVESPGFLTDTITGSRREFDVLVSADGSTRVSEVRDRGASVGVAEVEAFVTKTRDTGAKMAAIISTRGFGGPALTKASHYGIACFYLRIADTGYWDGTPTMAFSAVVPDPEKPTQFRFEVDGRDCSGLGAESVRDDAGRQVDLHAVARRALAAIQSSNEHLDRTGAMVATLTFERPGLVICEGERTEVDRIVVSMPITVHREVVQTTAYGLYDPNIPKAPPIVEMHVCPKAFGEGLIPPGRLAVGGAQGGALGVVVVRNPEAKKCETEEEAE